MKLLLVVFLFGVGSQLLGQDAYDTPEERDREIQRQEQRENHIRIQEENKRWKQDKIWLSEMRHKKIRMKHKINVHKKTHEQRKKFKRKVKQRRLINFLMGMVVGYHIGVK